MNRPAVESAARSARAEPRAAAPGGPEPASPAGTGPRRRWPRRLVPVLLVAAAAGVLAWRYERTAAEEPAVLELLGNIDVRQVNLSFKVAGRIESLAVDEGDPVKAGEVIARLDERYFADDLRLARAQRDQAAANYEKLKNGSRPEEIEQARAVEAEQQASLRAAEEEYSRAQRLRVSGAMAAEEFERRRSAWLEARAKLASAAANRKLVEIGPRPEDIAAARAQLAQAEARLIEAERRDEDSRLVAPNDGTILTRAREKGAIVGAGGVVFALTLAEPVWVRTYVGEPDLGTVQPGLAVTVTTDAPGGRAYRGHVGFVSPTAEFTPKTVETRELRTDLVYRVRVVIEDADGGLRQGMPVTASIALPGSRPRTFRERLWEALGFRPPVRAPGDPGGRS